MRKNTQTKTTPKTKLSTWLFRAPAKFSIAATLLSMFGVFLYSMIIKAAVAWPIFLIIGVATLLCAIWMWRGMPRNLLNRRDFIAIDFGLALIAIIVPIIMFFVSISLLTAPLMSQPLIAGLIMLLVSFMAFYQIGLVVANIQPLYFRARALGVPKWKVIMSLPFSMLTLPGFLLTATTEPADSVHIGAAWYDRFISRITQRETYIWATFITIFIAAILISPGALTVIPMMVTFVLIYLIWVRIQGRDNMRQNIGGAFASTAVVLNIIFVAAYVILVSMGIKNAIDLQKNAMIGETLVVTETVVPAPASQPENIDK